MDLFKEIIPAILQKKVEVFSNNPEAEKSYIPFIVNRALSQHSDTILLANQMNMAHHVDKDLQISFYLNTVQARKRPFVRWTKPLKNEDLQAVMQYYGYSYRKAVDAIEILTTEQITDIKQRVFTGE